MFLSIDCHFIICFLIYLQEGDHIAMADKNSHTVVQVLEPVLNGLRTSDNPKKSLQGTTLSFHNVNYKVKINTGMICCRKTVKRQILTDAK